MPCNTITTTTLDLSNASVEVLASTLVSLGLTLQEHTLQKIVATNPYGTRITWEKGKGTIVKTSDNTLATRIPQAYAATTLQLAAKRNNWTVKQTAENKYQIVRK